MPPQSGNLHSDSSRSHRGRPSSTSSPREQASIFLRATDWGLLAAFSLVPFLMGGRQASGQLALVVCATWAALALAAHQLVCPKPTWRPTRAEPLLLAGIGLGLLQISSLPAEWLSRLSPHLAEMLPAWHAGPQGDSELGGWTQLSLAPAATRSALVVLAAYALIFVVAAQRIQKVHDVERILRWVCYVGTAMAAFGLVQYLTSNGKFFWVYEHPFTNTLAMPKGSFTNRNHFGQFLALGVAPLLWWIIAALNGKGSAKAEFGSRSAGEGQRQLQIGILLLALGTLVFAELLSLSRGGIVAMFVAALCCLCILVAKGQASGKLLAGLCTVGLLVGSSLFIFGFDNVSGRLEDWESGRSDIWRANLAIFSDFPMVGTGTGSHVEVYKAYLDQPFDKREFTHAESSVLQLASETGAAGLTLAGIAVLMCGYWCVRGLTLSPSRPVSLALATITGCLAASLTHAFLDVVWYLPGAMVIVVVLAACACRLCQMGRDARTTQLTGQAPAAWRVPKLASLVALLAVGALGAWMTQQKLPELLAETHWHQYLRLSLATDEDDESADASPDGKERLRKQMLALQSAARANPDNARLQHLMASGFLRIFRMKQESSENPMTLSQVRDAALASNFESLEAQNQWIGVAVGDNRKFLQAALDHNRSALKFCPLQGRAYLNLAELSFLESLDREAPERYIEQALILRPYDARVLFIAGREAWTSGDFPRGIEHWRAAFHRSYVYQQFIIQMLAPNVPAQFFIETFAPDRHALQRLTKQFRTLNKPQDYAYLLGRFAQSSVELAQQSSGKEAIEAWLQAHGAFDELKDAKRALACLQNALKSDPTSYETHYAAGAWFYEHGEFAAAAEHLVWCSQRRPRDAELKILAERAAKHRLQAPSDIRTVSGEAEIGKSRTRE